MLEMGVPVAIIDLAERMIRLSGCQVGTDIPIEITGIRPGREARRGAAARPDEEVLGTSHPYINRLVPDPGPGRRVRRRARRARAGHRSRRGQGDRPDLLFTAGGRQPDSSYPAGHDRRHPTSAAADRGARVAEAGRRRRQRLGRRPPTPGRTIPTRSGRDRPDR